MSFTIPRRIAVILLAAALIAAALASGPPPAPTASGSAVCGAFRREERLCFSNSSLTGLDELENAALVSRTPTTATWRVQAGGRQRTVIGQAAVDGGC